MDWAAPDVSTPVGPSPAPAAPAAPTRRAPATAMRRLGPMTAFDILDGAFTILRRAPGTVLGVTAIFVIPAELLGAYVVRNVNTEAAFAVFETGDSSLVASDQASGGDFWLGIFATLAPSVALVFVAAGLTRLVSAWQVGHDLSVGELVRGMRRLVWPLLASLALIKVAELVGLMLCVLPALAVMAWFLVTVPAISAEGLGPVEGMRRSARLVGRRFWPVLWIGVLSALVTLFFGSAIEAIPQLLLWISGADSFGWVVAGLSGAVSAVLTTPVVAGAAVLTYLDLRVRTEGLDLELEALDVFPSKS